MLKTSMFKVQVFIFLITYVRYSSCVIDALYATGRSVWELYSIVDGLNLNDMDKTKIIDELLGCTDAKNQKIKNQINEIHKQLNAPEYWTNLKIGHNWTQFFPSKVTLVKCMDTIEIFISSIDEDYKEFNQLISNNSCEFNGRFQDSIKPIISSIESKIQLIRQIMTKPGGYLPDDKNLAFAIAGYASVLLEQMCGGPQIISEILVQLFKMVIIAEIKANVMLAFANVYRYTRNEEWKNMNSRAREQFANLFGSYVDTLAMNLDAIDGTYIRACDPHNNTWIRNENYYELEGTSQATIFQYHWASCMIPNCNNIWLQKSTQCNPKYYDQRSGCSYEPTECAYLGAMQACVLKSGPYKYKYVNSTKLGLLGRNSECPKDDGYMINDGTGWNSAYAACACNCYGNHNKISLAIMRSAVEKNMVITGLRYIRKDRILYIQPKQGKLNANGYISQYSERWVSIPNNNRASQIHSIDRQNRAFFFDDVRLPPKYVLTGVKFSTVKRGIVDGFSIKIFGVPFDYETGQLDIVDVIQISSQLSTYDAGKRLSFEPINSAYTTLHHTASPEDRKYVLLERSRLAHDFGQTTLPLFDALPITTHPPSPLGGIGIFHKGLEGYAGFISLRAYGIKYAKYFRDFKSTHTRDNKVLFNSSKFN